MIAPHDDLDVAVTILAAVTLAICVAHLLRQAADSLRREVGYRRAWRAHERAARR